MFAIEVLTVSPELHKPITLAMEALNGLQNEFQFAFPSDDLIAKWEVEQTERYSAKRIFVQLSEYRQEAKGHRPFLVLIVDGFLTGDGLTNIFGSHDAENGVATFTVHDSGRFVHDQVRFIRYYLVRYSLSFLAPKIKSHVVTRSCFFDKKISKMDLKLSMESGDLCPDCRTQLAPIWTPPIKRAIEAMAKFIAGDYPHALVMKGGGVKGLAFAGAMLVLEDYFTFDVFAGTSAGSIAALLFAAKYTPRELQDELANLDFRKFKDASLLKRVINLISKRGLFPGDALTKWIGDRLKNKLQFAAEVRMKDLPFRAIVYASSPALGILIFDSARDRREALAAFAARCSASIPYYFTRQSVDGHSVYDGGLRENFPFEAFLNQNKGKPTVGLYLTAPAKSSGFVVADLINVAASGDDPNTIRTHADKIVPIDPSPIKTTDFNLSADDKRLLISAGQSAARRFLLTRKVEGAPSESDVLESEAVTRELRILVAKQRRRRL